MFKLFEIKEGKFKVLPTLNPKHIKGFIIISIIALIIAGFSDHFKIDEKQLWKIYTAIIEKFGLKQDIPDLPDHQKQLDAKVELEVDKAIRNYWREIKESPAEVYKPRYIEEENDESVCYTEECKALAPPMRLCAPWVDNCPQQ
jgi:hypothetical protein